MAALAPFHGPCVEGVASGPAIAAFAGAPAETLPDEHPVFERVSFALARLVADIVLAHGVERIVLGGGVVDSRSFLRERAATQAETLIAGYGAFELVVEAPHHERPGLEGALLLLDE